MTTPTLPVNAPAATNPAVPEAFEEDCVDKFIVRPTGLAIETADGITPITAFYVKVIAIGSDGNDDQWSILLEWKTPNDQLRFKAFPIARIHGDWSSLVVELTRQGLIVPPVYLNQFRMYLSLAIGAPTIPRVRLISKIGFFPLDPAIPDGAYGFMLPKGPVLPADAEIGPVLFMPPFASPTHQAYGAAGTLDEWKEALAPAAGNALWVFDHCLGFAAVMLEVIGAENVCFHTWGETSGGKSTGGQMMASVFGCAANSQQSLKPSLFQNWTATANGIETLAVAHSGGGMFLDEIGALPQGASLNIYAILQGRMKARMNEFGGMREQHNWRNLLLSTGEISVRQRIEQEGPRKVMGGEMIRALDIPVDELPPDALLTREAGEHLANHLRQFLGEHYGTAGVVFIQGLMEAFPTFEALREDLNLSVNEAHELLCTHLNQYRPLLSAHKRALRHFALIYAVGRWAVQAEASPFSEEHVTHAVLSVATAWLQEFPHLSEQDKLLHELRAYIQTHCFHMIITQKTSQAAFAHNRKPQMLLHDGKVWLSPERFEAVCGELPMKKASKMLDRMGLLHRHEGDGQHKTKVSIWPAVFGPTRYYAFYADKLFTAAELESLSRQGPSRTPARESETIEETLEEDDPVF
jgi:putative DNA primase/helicase